MASGSQRVEEGGRSNRRRRSAVVAALVLAALAVGGGVAQATVPPDQAGDSAATSRLLAKPVVGVEAGLVNGYLSGDRALTAQAVSRLPAVRAELRDRLPDRFAGKPLSTWDTVKGLGR